MSFTLATLTCNDRAVLFDVINEVLDNTNFTRVDWMIYAQGCSNLFLDNIRKCFNNNRVNLSLITNPINLGYSSGMNNVWNNVSHYDYVLFLEDDWRISNVIDKNWLNICLDLLKQRQEIDIIYLRKYITDQEKWQYGWTRHINYYCFQGRLQFNYASQMARTVPFMFNGLTFQQIPRFMYSANPCIYKTSSYKKCNVFPMINLNDKHDVIGQWDNSSVLNIQWGCAEALAMEKTSDLYTIYLCDGLFHHNSL